MEKLSPKESVKGAVTMLRGSVRDPEGFNEGKSEAAKSNGAQPPRVCLKKIPREPSHCPAAQCRHPRHSLEGTVIPLMRFTGKRRQSSHCTIQFERTHCTI